MPPHQPNDHTQRIARLAVEKLVRHARGLSDADHLHPAQVRAALRILADCPPAWIGQLRRAPAHSGDSAGWLEPCDSDGWPGPANDE